MSENRKENIKRQITGEPDDLQELASSGINCGVLSESTPNFIDADCENVINGANNSYIVLGRDRPGSLKDGYGGKGHTGAGAIDLVVGRPGDSENKVHPDFVNDAARIHISQKTDIDDNFKLDVTEKAVESSGIGVKADHIRIMGRRSLKLVTNTDATGETKNGVEIIANNNSATLQPMVKGDNLEEALTEIVKKIDQLSGVVSRLVADQQKYNLALQAHIHNSPFYGTPKTLPSLELVSPGFQVQNSAASIQIDIKNFKQGIATIKKKYLMKSGKETYINSENNKVN